MKRKLVMGCRWTAISRYVLKFMRVYLSANSPLAETNFCRVETLINSEQLIISGARSQWYLQKGFQ